MERLTDDELIEELKKRFEDKTQAYEALKIVTKKLETLNKKLVESEALKGDFLSNIRNEINNPLSSIMGLSGQISAGGDPSTIGDIIYAEAFDLNFQLTNILAAAEIEAGEAALSVSTIDVAHLISSAVGAFAHRTKAKGLATELACGDLEAPFFRTDPGRLRIIVSNLLANAIEYSLDGGRIEVRVCVREGQLSVSVRDFGIGIDESDHAAVFDRFKQLESGMRKGHRGHGLGLSVTKALAELLEGKIAVSGAKGKGCTFTVTLPEADEREANAFSDEGNEYIFEGEEKKEEF